MEISPDPLRKGLEKLSRPVVKLCGTTSAEDRRIAEEAGADYFGVVLDVPYSPRSRSIHEAAEIFKGAEIPGVALLTDSSPDVVCSTAERLGPYALQLLGHSVFPDTILWLKTRVSCRLWRTLNVWAEGEGAVDIHRLQRELDWYREAGIDAIIVDTMIQKEDRTRYGGTGATSDWNQVRKVFAGAGVFRFLAGGINPDNVVRAVETVRPNGIDLASGVESAPGKRDPERVRQLMENLRKANL